MRRSLIENNIIIWTNWAPSVKVQRYENTISQPRENKPMTGWPRESGVFFFFVKRMILFRSLLFLMHKSILYTSCIHNTRNQTNITYDCTVGTLKSFIRNSHLYYTYKYIIYYTHTYTNTHTCVYMRQGHVLLRLKTKQEKTDKSTRGWFLFNYNTTLILINR